jgi:hypothetical protein
LYAALLISGLMGLVLGTRFPILILAPAVVLAWLAVAVMQVILQQPLGATIWMLVAVALGLQIGYLGGILTRYVMVALRVARAAKRATPRIPVSP